MSDLLTSRACENEEAANIQRPNVFVVKESNVLENENAVDLQRTETTLSQFVNRYKVVFDIDDTIWPYTQKIAKMADVSYEDWIDFHTLNPRFTSEQKDKITAAYHSPDPYREMVFYDGFADILQLEAHGALVQFKSNSFTQELLDLKEEHLRAVLPQLRPEQLILCVVDVAQNTQKRFDDDTFIIVDDNPHSIAKAKAPYAIMPQVPWNQSAEMRALVAHKRVFYVPSGDLPAIYRIVIDLLKQPPNS